MKICFFPYYGGKYQLARNLSRKPANLDIKGVARYRLKNGQKSSGAIIILTSPLL